MTLTQGAASTSTDDILTASISGDGAATVVSFIGEVDALTRPTVVDVLARVIADFDGPVIADLSQTNFIDSAGAHALARAWQFLDDHGRTMTVRSASRMALHVLDLLDMSHLVERDDGRC